MTQILQKKCNYYQGAIGYNIEECITFRAKVQRLLILKVLVIERPLKETDARNVCMTGNNGNWALKSLTLSFFMLTPAPVPSYIFVSRTVVLQRPTPFPYQNTHAIPWNYEGRAVIVASLVHTAQPYP